MCNLSFTSLKYIFSTPTGTRVWLDIHKNVEVICELAYYGLTTLCVRQTLGEEYTGILQVDSSRRKLPSVWVSKVKGNALSVLPKYVIGDLRNST